MNYELFETIINKDTRSKAAILRECGISHPGFTGVLANKSVKVEFLERFCVVTKTHISRFFEDWYVTESEQNIPALVAENSMEYKKSLTDDIKLLLQAKNDLIEEQRDRIKELSELVSMFKSGKIKLT